MWELLMNYLKGERLSSVWILTVSGGQVHTRTLWVVPMGGTGC